LAFPVTSYLLVLIFIQLHNKKRLKQKLNKFASLDLLAQKVMLANLPIQNQLKNYVSLELLAQKVMLANLSIKFKIKNYASLDLLAHN